MLCWDNSIAESWNILMEHWNRFGKLSYIQIPCYHSQETKINRLRISNPSPGKTPTEQTSAALSTINSTLVPLISRIPWRVYHTEHTHSSHPAELLRQSSSFLHTPSRTLGPLGISRWLAFTWVSNIQQVLAFKVAWHYRGKWPLKAPSWRMQTWPCLFPPASP